MKYGLLLATLTLALTGCTHVNVIPTGVDCGRLIPPTLKKPVPPVDLPEPRSFTDGHQDAEPWMVGFLEQTGQLDKANDRSEGIDYIYSQCERLNNEAIAKSRRGFFARLFG